MAGLIDTRGESVATLRRLLTGTARLYLWRYLLAIAFMAVTAAATAGMALIIEDVVNEIFVNRDRSKVFEIAAIICAIYLVKGAATYGQLVTMGRINNSIVARMQTRLYDRLVEQSVGFYERYDFGEIALRVGTCANAAREALNLIIVGFGRDAISLAALVGVMVYQDWRLALFAFVTAPPAILGVSYLIKRIKKVVRVEMDSFARILSTTKETRTGIKVIKAFNLEERMRQTAHEAIAAMRNRADKGVALKARTSPIMETLGGLAVAGAVLYSGARIIGAGADPGSFVSFITALFAAYEPAKRLAKLHVSVGGALVQTRLLYDLLDEPVDIVDHPEATDLAVGEGRIEVDNVHFAYGRETVLRGLSFVARPRQVTALVGPSGAGKSTVFSLIERFVVADSGTITIDGTDIARVTARSLRDNIALVTQDTYLFEGTIGQNIALGNPHAGPDAVIEAARNAHAHDFIAEFEDGYDAEVGEGGSRLSGGQRQRVAIARAMLRDAPILLLDEATASLDAESESKVQEALDRLMADRTTIVIAHRLATVRNADIIHVMDKGVVVQSGSHEHLLEQGGLYASLYKLQFDDGSSGAG